MDYYHGAPVGKPHWHLSGVNFTSNLKLEASSWTPVAPVFVADGDLVSYEKEARIIEPVDREWGDKSRRVGLGLLRATYPCHRSLRCGDLPLGDRKVQAEASAIQTTFRTTYAGGTFT